MKRDEDTLMQERKLNRFNSLNMIIGRQIEILICLWKRGKHHLEIILV